MLKAQCSSLGASALHHSCTENMFLFTLIGKQCLFVLDFFVVVLDIKLE